MRYRYMTGEQIEALFEQSQQDARARVGDTPEEKARWLLEIGFQQVNGYDLPKEQIYALRWEMDVFLSTRVDVARGPTLGVTEKQAHRWLKLIQEGVQNLAKGKLWSLRPAGRYHCDVPLDTDSLTGRWLIGDRMKQTISEVLSAVEGRLRRCKRPGCRRLFVAHKRQEYCRKSCSNKVRVGKYRHKQRRVMGNKAT